MTPRLLAAAALFASVPLAAQAHEEKLPCATAEQTANIRNYYASMRPGVPLPVPSRYFNVTELTVASALPVENAAGTPATPERVKQIWTSIDGWGATTKVTLVVSPNSRHAFAFPSLVPITQDDPKPGYIDVYADEGRGVHSHIQLDKIAAVYAHTMPTPDPQFHTRGISFFGPNGDLVLGVYASINKAAYDAKAVAGFERTFALIKSLPRVCG